MSGNNINSAPLPDHYHGSRKQYGLFSALLIIWSLVPLTPTNNNPPIVGNIEITDFRLLPWCLLILIIYSGIRITIEWFALDVRRREQKPPKYDFWISHSIAVTAIIVFIVKELSMLELFKKSTASFLEILIPFFIGVFIPFLFYKSLNLLLNDKSGDRKSINVILPILLGWLVIAIIYYIAAIKSISIFSIISFFVPLWFGIVLILFRKLVLGKVGIK